MLEYQCLKKDVVKIPKHFIDQILASIVYDNCSFCLTFILADSTTYIVTYSNEKKALKC